MTANALAGTEISRQVEALSGSVETSPHGEGVHIVGLQIPRGERNKTAGRRGRVRTPSPSGKSGVGCFAGLLDELLGGFGCVYDLVCEGVGLCDVE